MLQFRAWNGGPFHRAGIYGHDRLRQRCPLTYPMTYRNSVPTVIPPPPRLQQYIIEYAAFACLYVQYDIDKALQISVEQRRGWIFCVRFAKVATAEQRSLLFFLIAISSAIRSESVFEIERRRTLAMKPRRLSNRKELDQESDQ